MIFRADFNNNNQKHIYFSMQHRKGYITMYKKRRRRKSFKERITLDMQEQRSSITKQVVDTLLFKNANMQVTI